MEFRNVVFGVMALSFPLGAAAQVAPVSPYTGMQEREIKALSAEEVAGLLNGDGMSMALAAELNGYPGPKHVLELADSLDLTTEQRARTQEIFDRMQERARELGAEIVEVERRLDDLFVERTIDAPALVSLTNLIGSRRGELRAEHLRAHLEMATVLTEHQVMRYVALRGYGEAGHTHGHVPP